MRQAAAALLGTHDFFNFSKRDPSKTLPYNTVRTILQSEIVSLKEEEGENPLDLFYYRIRGTAFLYHQVRCTMAILFLVGMGLEEPSVVERLLRERGESRPALQMASEIPLVLQECGYESSSNFSSGQQQQEVHRIQTELYREWRVKTIQSLTLRSILDPGLVDFANQPEYQSHRSLI